MKSIGSDIFGKIGRVLVTLACGLVLADAAVISPGVKAEIKGRINKRDVDTIMVRDANDMDTVVIRVKHFSRSRSTIIPFFERECSRSRAVEM